MVSWLYKTFAMVVFPLMGGTGIQPAKSNSVIMFSPDVAIEYSYLQVHYTATGLHTLSLKMQNKPTDPVYAVSMDGW
jgi:hypothetical protein